MEASNAGMKGVTSQHREAQRCASGMVEARVASDALTKAVTS